LIPHRYNVNFVGMVLPGDELIVKLRHIGMRDGNIVVKIETNNGRCEKVLEGSVEYVFTGQGLQEPGMGLDLYNTSPAAHAVLLAFLVPNRHLSGSNRI
jgi:fatty acid synthase subunit alpha, fungi type